ncbi:hypothetical protein [Myxococcus vastator]|uniref:hypothetical protein n=1 Tax=Myxococcus vastator TaxID=2709664 RepID=UPI0013CF7C2E|nr:hypothetical protein [Myxococcus vastator]
MASPYDILAKYNPMVAAMRNGMELVREPEFQHAVGIAAAKIVRAELFQNPHLRNRAIIEFVARAGLVSTDQVINRYIREEGESLFDAQRRGGAILKRLMLGEYLQARPVVVSTINLATAGDVHSGDQVVDAVLKARKWAPMGRQVFTRAVYVTPKAAGEFNLPLPPTFRENFVQHHLKTMDALLQTEKELLSRGYKVLDIKGEEKLIREAFRAELQGRAGQGQQRKAAAHYPDAQLVVVTPTGERQAINIEYVTGKYTDKMIAAKAASFSGPTIWAADKLGTARRIERITGQEALLV